MSKKAFLCYLLTAVLCFGIIAVPATAAPVDTSAYDSVEVSRILQNTDVHNLKAKASLLMEVSTGRILLEKNMHEKLPLASITKVMSMLLFMEAIDSGKLSLDDIVVASEHAASMGGSQAYIAPGEQFTVRDALKAVAIHSSNDVTVALAEKIAGSEEVFVARMNQKAKELGMKNTNFLDCTGLDEIEFPDHYSSAYDIAIMSRELILKHPSILEYTGTFIDKFRDGKFDLVNTNKLVHFYNGCDGLKTGYTSKAGYCLAATAERDGMRLISVILGGPDTNTRFAETRKLLDYGFANYRLITKDTKGDVLEGHEAIIKKGVKTKVALRFGDDAKLLVKYDEADKVERDVRLISNITAPVQEGQKLGTVVYVCDGNEVGQVDLVAAEKVDKASFIRLFFRMIARWFGFGKE